MMKMVVCSCELTFAQTRPAKAPVPTQHKPTWNQSESQMTIH